MPKVSIIVPIYNVEEYIEKCARSLFSQTLGDIEYIFIDDRSPDRSVEILQRVIREYQTRIQEKHWIIKIERMVKNSGQSAVRRHGIQLASGDYVFHCDSDDWVEKDMISDMWNLANQDDLDVVVCDFTHVKGGEIVYYKGMKAHDAEGFFYEVLSDQSSWAVWNKLFKRSLYSHVVFPKDGMNVGEDMVMVIQLLYYSSKVGHINKSLYNYCDNVNSIMNRKTSSDIISNFIQWYSNISFLDSLFKNKTIIDWKKNIEYLCNLAIHDVLVRFDSINPSKTSQIIKLCLVLFSSIEISFFCKMVFLNIIRSIINTSMKYRLSLVFKR